ncbi:MAG: IS481 family transposase [Candidatus Methylomirabilales bacterium]
MSHRAKELEQVRKARGRLRMIQHYEQVTRNVGRTCRFFGISGTQFYIWLRRYRQGGLAGLRDGPRGPRAHHYRTPPHIEALVLRLRRERQYGALRLSLFLQRSHRVYLSPPTLARILQRHRMPRVSLKRYRPGPRRRRELRIPGLSVQVDVKHLKLGSGRLYQFTAINEATRYRVLQLYDHTSVKSATVFIDEVRQRPPVAIQRIKTDHGSEFGTDFTWHLHDLGITHRPIPRGSPESTGKVERSHRTDEEKVSRRVTFRSPQELRRLLREWEHEYNHRRPHLALGGKTPAERLCELRIMTPQGVRETARLIQVS